MNLIIFFSSRRRLSCWAVWKFHSHSQVEESRHDLMNGTFQGAKITSHKTVWIIWHDLNLNTKDSLIPTNDWDVLRANDFLLFAIEFSCFSVCWNHIRTSWKCFFVMSKCIRRRMWSIWEGTEILLVSRSSQARICFECRMKWKNFWIYLKINVA